MKTTSCFTRLGTVLIMLAGTAGILQAQDAETFAKSMKYTKEVVSKHHLIALVNVEPFEGGKKVDFRYDKYPTAERVIVGEETFARKKGGAWLKSNDYGETGKKVKKEKATELDVFVSFADAPMSDKFVTREPEQGGRVIEFLKREDAGDSERLFYEVRREKSTNVGYPQFVFRPWKAGNDDESLLIGYGGLMRTGEMRVKVNINYQYMFLVNAVVRNANEIPPAKEGAEEQPPKPPKGRKAAETEPPAPVEDPDKVYGFMELQRNKMALNGKVVRLEVTTQLAMGKDAGKGRMRAMVHDTAKDSFIGWVDLPKAQFEKLGFADNSKEEKVTLYVRVNATNAREPATFSAVGQRAVKGADGEAKYEW
jgi:hypothetical protein